MNEPPAISLSLWAADIEALSAFLVDAAGLTLVESYPGFAALEQDGYTLELHADEDYRGHPWYQALGQEGVTRGLGTEIRVRVDDAQKAFGRALRAGGISVQAPYPTTETVTECHVMGPEGYLFVLWSSA